MDVDADRRLAFPEFRQGLSFLGMTSATIPESIAKLDYNGNGLVSLAEMDGCVTAPWLAAINDQRLVYNFAIADRRAYKATLRNPDGYVHKSQA
eukprot:Skav212468  [mRNA]  locus=scaffold385:317427:319369:- [translate_table: standard]